MKNSWIDIDWLWSILIMFVDERFIAEKKEI